ncbi:MAG: hypothetical protein MUF01_05265 [Bryobacterales bacterium]|jgi:predicted Fe-Mo cluster-binding NifX family protein|nr:hypothetical protein [Bryobacterales bacterium]
MRIAIPTSSGELNPHFGKCTVFAIIDCDTAKSTLLKMELVEAPPHEQGLLPRWLQQLGVDLVIAGRLGGRAQERLQGLEIPFITGAPTLAPDVLVRSFLNGSLVCQSEACTGNQRHHADGEHQQPNNATVEPGHFACG